LLPPMAYVEISCGFSSPKRTYNRSQRTLTQLCEISSPVLISPLIAFVGFKSQSRSWWKLQSSVQWFRHSLMELLIHFFI
jgi:hypothetical protein